MADDSKHVMIAHIEEKRYDKAIPVLCFIGLLVGLLAITVLALFETSAIRLAADGAIWTGWNVFCGIGILSRRPVHYFVYRQRAGEG